MATRLKVFTWSDGFHAYTVAVGSRPAALQAWGIHQDLFKSGLATEAPDGPDHDAALAAPGTVISRGLVIDIGQTGKAKPRRIAAGALDRLNALERELASLDAVYADQADRLRAQRIALDREASALTDSHDEARLAVLTRIASARKAAS